MNRIRIRNGLIAIGIFASLVIFLYLPVLIWSPPWGVNGYYIHEYYVKVHIHKGSAKIQHFEGDEWKALIWKGDYWRSQFHSIYFEKIGADSSKCHSKVKFNENGILYYVTKALNAKSIEQIETDEVLYELTLTKTMNPLEVWHLKWLEWTSK